MRGEIEGDPSALYFWRHVGLFDPAQNILFVNTGRNYCTDLTVGT
jgi:hypothetical protein